LRFRGDPARAANAGELKRQAQALGNVIDDRDHSEPFGLLQVGDRGAGVPRIESVRSARRIGPDGQVVFDIVAEITQQRIVKPSGERGVVIFGGSTVILGPEGEIRYVIGKGVGSERRVEGQVDFVTSEKGLRYWEEKQGVMEPKPDTLRALHEHQPTALVERNS
jgi:hypothetical protein